MNQINSFSYIFQIEFCGELGQCYSVNATGRDTDTIDEPEEGSGGLNKRMCHHNRLDTTRACGQAVRRDDTLCTANDPDRGCDGPL